MASYLLPSSFQKRFLRYALSKLELLDTDALDLEKLDIAWGKRSTVELKDVGLHIDKLSSLLHLPPNLLLTSARILVLKVTIPTDIYRSAIIFEIQGVAARARLVSQEGDATLTTRHRRKRRRKDGNESAQDNDGLQESSLPDPSDLAKSFLQTEPQKDREDIQAALLNDPSSSSAGLDDDLQEGMGGGYALPGFLTDFLQGVSNRLEVSVRNVEIDVETELPSSDTARLDSSIASVDAITLRLSIESLLLHGGDTRTEVEADAEGQSLPSTIVSDRKITLQNISGWLISDSSLFEAMEKSIPSTSSPRSKRSKRSGQPTRSATGQSGSSGTMSASSTDSYPEDSQMLQSTILSTSRHSEGINDDTRFADASDDDDRSYTSSLQESQELLRSDAHRPFSLRAAFNAPATLDQFADDIASSTGSLDSIPTFSSPPRQRPNQPRFEDLLQSTSKISVRPSPAPRPFASQIHPAQSSFPHRDPPSSMSLNFNQDPGHMQSSIATNISDDVDPEPKPPPSQLPVPNERDELAESKLFTHEEAESMYMSALSEAPDRSSHDGLDMPGAWNEPGSAEASALPAKGRDLVPSGFEKSTQPSSWERESSRVDAQLETTEPDLSSSRQTLSNESVTESDPQPSPEVAENEVSLESSNLTATGDTRLAKQLLFIDTVEVVIPTPTKESNAIVEPWPGMVSKPKPSAMPGAFSATIDASSSDSLFESITETRPPTDTLVQSTLPHQESRDKTDPTSINMKSLSAQIDIALLLLILKLSKQLLDSFSSSDGEASATSDETPDFLVSLRIEEISLKLLEYLKAVKLGSSRVFAPARYSQFELSESDIVLQTIMRQVAFSTFNERGTSQTQLHVGKFVFGHDQDPILSFLKSGRVSTIQQSQMMPEHDFILSSTVTDRANRLSFNSRPIHISFDLQRLDETFAWFGGVSSILGMKSSVISASIVKGAVESAPATKGVRFEAPTRIKEEVPATTTTETQIKLDMRAAGLSVDLIGRECAIAMSTSTLKAVYRSEGVGLQIDKISLSGATSSRRGADAPVKVDIDNARIEYLLTPKETDLTRLLSLLAPSNNKYDEEDDILVDTLLRQRRKGAVLRTGVGSLHCSIASLDTLEQFSTLGNEIAKLSSVTKYLPEDDRPGILSLLLVKDLGLSVNIGHSLGDVYLYGTNLDLAHVGVPALLAMGLETLKVECDGVADDLVGEAIPREHTSEKHITPMIIARMIGDEMDPTIKIKLWNLRVEYRVPFIKALLDLKDNMTTEEAIADLAVSVATLTRRSDSRPSTPRPSSSDSPALGRPESKRKPLKFNVIIRDSLIGLNPHKSPAKGLVVFTEAKLVIDHPGEGQMLTNFNIGNASLLIIDDMNNMLSLDEIADPLRKRRSVHYLSPQISDLCTSGFVSVSNMRSAKVIVKIIADTGVDGSNFVDVELKDQLLVLESCADSTQTLIGILNGLLPPTPPSKEIKYRTQVVPVQDMLASLSGDAFAQSQDDDYVEQFPTSLDDDDDDEEGDDLEPVDGDEGSQNFGLMSRLYGDESQISTATSKASEGSSILKEEEDDVSQAENAPMLEGIQTTQAIHDEEPLDFREDHFGTGSQMPGKARKWDSNKNAYGQKNEYEVAKSPLKMRVRDVHIIWNLFDGFDWQRTRDAISKAVRDVESKAIERRRQSGGKSAFDQPEEEDTVIGDFLFNSIYIGIPANRDPRELANAINRNVDDLASEAESYAASTATETTTRAASSGPRIKSKRLKLHRSKHHKLAFELKGVSADIVIFPPDSGETQSSIDLRVRDLEIFDHVPSSAWKKFATYMHDAGERELDSSMIHVELVTVKPVPELAASEIVLKISVLPLRLHVDQDALDFMTRFFEFKDDSAPDVVSQGELPFLQRVEVNSVRVMLDYKPKKVDYAGLRSGHTTEFMNFFILDQANMTLRHVIIYGTLGFEKLGRTLNDVWMPDVRQNQLPGILAGLTPIRPLVNVGSGVRDLVAVPIREYRKDGRVVRSIRKGTLAFAKTTTTELVKLGAKLAIGTQTVLQGAEGLLSPSTGVTSDPISTGGGVAGGWDDASLDTSSDEEEAERKTVISPYADQPVGVMQGLRGAYATLEKDLLTTRDAIVAVPGEVMESGNATGAAKAVLKRAPTIILRPAIGASKAIGQTMLGAANSLDPKERRRTTDKYKRH